MQTFAPRQLPPISALREKLGNPPVSVIADHLGVAVRTVWGWLAKDEAPRAALLALFYETRWGAERINCDAINEADLYRGLVSALRAEVYELRRELARVVHLGDFGAANVPTQVLPREYSQEDDDGRRAGGEEVPHVGGVPLPVAQVIQLFPRADHSGRDKREHG